MFSCSLQAMLEMDDTGALLRFVQRPNQVSLAEGEEALRAVGRYLELVALYQSRGRYEAALDLLRSLALVRLCLLQYSAVHHARCVVQGSHINN